jgi:UDP-glucose 4-epimerase
VTPPARTLVVGARGLLGGGVVRELTRRGAAPATVEVPWHDRDAAVSVLVDATTRLAAQGGAWRVLWCAGAGVVATSPAALEAEVSTFTGYVDGLAARLVEGPAASPGALFLASSAGGVHAGSADPPFSEDTEPRPISPYGEAKLATEQVARRFARASGVPVVIGRIANLYGPGQDPTKAQGLVSQLCRAHLERRPTSIYVSLDTARDYLFVDDAARLVLGATERAAAGPPGTAQVKIMGSQRATTVAMILGELRRVSRRKPLVVLGVSPLAAFQTRDLRFRSRVWTDLDAEVATTLPAGILATLASASEALRAPSAVAAGR